MKKTLALLLAIALLTGCGDNSAPSAETVQTLPETQETAETAESAETSEAASAEDFQCHFQSGNVAQITRYKGDDEVVIIPERIGDCTVTSVAKNAFAGTSVREVTFPSTVTVVYGLQSAAQLETLNLPPVVDSISSHFIGCDRFSCINISGNFKTVDGVVYSADGRTLVCCPPAKKGSFTVPEGVETIARYAFYGADISEVILPSTLTEIGEYAFYYCSSLPEVTLNEGLQVIGANAFTGTRVTDIYLPKSVRECGSTIIGWGGKRTVSASELTDGLEYLLMYVAEFRDESTLTKALRIADSRVDWYDMETNKVFVDVDGDNFPEMLEFRYDTMDAVLRRFDTEQATWLYMAEFYDELPYFWYGDSYYYHEPYYYCGLEDDASAQALAEVLSPAMAVVAEKITDPTKQFEVVMSQFSEEQGGEPTDMWRGQQITEYPYITAQYPDSWSVEANGIDILHGGAVEGVSFYNGTLTLDNAQLSSLEIDGMEGMTVEIELIGDCAITTEGEYLEYSGGALHISGDGTLTAYGIRGVDTEYTSSQLNIRGGAQVRLTKPATVGISSQDSAVQNISGVSVGGDGALYCEVLDTEDIVLDGNGRLECMHCEAYNALTLYDSASMLVEGDRDYTDWYTLSARLGVKMHDDSRLEVKSGIVSAVRCGWGDITLNDRAVMEVSVSDGWADCGIMLEETRELTINDSARLDVNGFFCCIEAPRIEINGGTLSCVSASNGWAIDLLYAQSPYSTFQPGFYVGGKVAEVSTDIAVFDEDFSLMTEEEKKSIERAKSVSITVEVTPLLDYYSKYVEKNGLPYGVLIEDINGDGTEELVIHQNPFGMLEVVYLSNGEAKRVACDVMSQWGGVWYDTSRNRIVNQYFCGHTEGTAGAYEYYVYDWDGEKYVRTMVLIRQAGYYEREEDGVTETDVFVDGQAYLNYEAITNERFEELHAELKQSMLSENRFDVIPSGALETDEALKQEQEERYSAYLAEKLY